MSSRHVQLYSTPPYAPPSIRAITTPLVTRAAPLIPCTAALKHPVFFLAATLTVLCVLYALRLVRATESRSGLPPAFSFVFFGGVGRVIACTYHWCRFSTRTRLASSAHLYCPSSLSAASFSFSALFLLFLAPPLVVMFSIRGAFHADALSAHN
ncbi:hypothetical protein C8J57DRAFT_1517820 [Mycena rebaudengoi]|nr:hypothetical protein C8J57DRAFT_1517820 [Mycena rebaudengoi]